MSNGEALFRVSITDGQRELLRQWHRLCVMQGVTPTIGQALAQVYELLQFQPFQWGEPYSHSPALALVRYRGELDGLLVFYGVDVMRHVVYVSEFRLASWHPLSRAGDL